MELIYIIGCVLISCAKLGSSVPFSDGNFGRNGHGTEWFMNQNFEAPQNEFNSQQFSLMNRNVGEFIPRNNYQNNVPSSINNVPNNGYREFINVPNFNSVNKIEPSIGNQMSYHSFDRRNGNAQASAFAGQNYNQETIQVNKELAEINQIIAQENMAAIEREKLREPSFQQNYVPNVIQRPQQTEPLQNYYPQNVNFGIQQPVMQSIRPETSIPITPQALFPEQNVVHQQSAPVSPKTKKQQDSGEEKKSILVVYPDGRTEYVTDIDQFMKANPDLIIQRRLYLPSQLPIKQKPVLQQQTQQITPQPQSSETPPESKPQSDEQISPQIQESESQKLLIKQPISQNSITSKQLQEIIANKSSSAEQITETQLPITLKPPSANSKSDEIVIPITKTAIQDMIKNVFENLNQKQNGELSENYKPQMSFKPQNLPTNEKLVKPVPEVERKIINVNLNTKQPTESLKPLPQILKSVEMTQNNRSYGNDGTPNTSNVVTTQILTPQTISNNQQIAISEKFIEKSIEKNEKSTGGSPKKFETLTENIVIPEIIFKIEDLNIQTKPISQTEKIIVSEEVITVEPTKEEIEIQVEEIIEKVKGSEEPDIPEKIIINEVKPKGKKNKSRKTKKGRPVEEIVVKEEINIENYDESDDDKKEKQLSKSDSKTIKEEVGNPKEPQSKDILRKMKADKLKKKEKQRNKEKTPAKKERNNKESVQQNQPVVEEIIIREEIEPFRRYKPKKYENRSLQQEQPVIREEIIQEEVENDDQPKKVDQRNKKKEESKRNEKEKYKEEYVKEEGDSAEEGDSKYIKETKESIRDEKLINKEIIRNGEMKRPTEVKQEDGMTVITTNVGEFYVEEVNNEDLVKLEQELNTSDSKENHVLAKEAFVFKTSDATIPESIKKHQKDGKKPIYLFQLIFPPTVDREVITTIYPNGTVVEEVNEYLCQMEEEQLEKMQEKKEKGKEANDDDEESNTTNERKRAEEERKRIEIERKKREEARKRSGEERKKREEKRKRFETEGKKVKEERKRSEEERKRTEKESKRTAEERKSTEEKRKSWEEERKRTEEERKKSEHERKRKEKERKRREEERKRAEQERNKKEVKRKRSEEESTVKEEYNQSVEERKITEEERQKSTEERKKSVEERKVTEEEHNKRKEEHKRTEEERKKRRERRKREAERKKREEEYKKKVEERKKQEEEEECED